MPRPTTTADPKPVRKPAAAKPRSAAARTAPAGTGSAQQAFLDELIRTGRRVSIFLVNGVKLEGEIRSYDRYVILMKNAVTDKVYKHAVSTILPVSGAATAEKLAGETRPRRDRRASGPGRA